MDRGTFMGSALLGMVAALVVFYPLGARRRAAIPSFVWWVCLIAGATICIYGLSHSTTPSFAPRIAAIGKVYDHVELRSGKDSISGFRFVPNGGGKPVYMETEIILPGWAVPQVFNGRTFRVIYLQSPERTLKNEAIDIEILVGRDAGFHDSFDARPAGVWLAVPIGAAIGVFGFFGLRYMKDDEKSSTADEDSPST